MSCAWDAFGEFIRSNVQGVLRSCPFTLSMPLPFDLIHLTFMGEGQPILFIPHCTHKFYSQRTAAFEGYFNYEVSWVLSTKMYYDLIGANRREAQLHAMRCRHLSASEESYEKVLAASPSIKSAVLSDKIAHNRYICQTHWDLISSFILRRRVVR